MAIFQELDTSMYDGIAILENASYIPKNIAVPRNVPVVESGDNYIAKFSDVAIVAEDYDLSYLDALTCIAEGNDIDPDSIYVAIDEADIICNPDIVNEFTVGDDNLVVVNPISEYSYAYRICEAACQLMEETGDENYLLALIDEAVGGNQKSLEQIKTKPNGDIVGTHEYNTYMQDIDRIAANKKLSDEDRSGLTKIAKATLQHSYDKHQKSKEKNKELGEKRAEKKGILGSLKTIAKRKGQTTYRAARDTIKNNKGKIGFGLGLGGASLLAYGYKKYKDNKEMNKLAEIQRQMANAPKSWIAKKIASLRSLYHNYLQKARLAKATGQAGLFTKIAHKILSVIDALMKKMQNMAG